MADSPGSSLQSSDRKALMDVIDKLRFIGINQHVDLPEIVVCGDQSSGKSSVLQAISGMSFPAQDNLCTRFATELVLRHTDNPVDNPCRVTIRPGPNRSFEEKAKLESFQPTHAAENNNIGPLVNEAKSLMGFGESHARFGDDVLRIEISGPDQPHLTIVDLPGLFRATNKDQNAEDRHIVLSLVRKYINNPRSIILAVVAASNNFVLQKATEQARDIDPYGKRTLALITKPDRLEPGSQTETDFFNMAQNKDPENTFELGWHILRNRDHASKDVSNEERDRIEEEFLGKGLWARLPSWQKGAAALKTRLSEVLLEHILKQLKDVIRDVEDGVADCNRDLEALGKARGNPVDQRQYLLDAVLQFQDLVREAIRGTYHHSRFFGNPSTEQGYKKRLRAVIQNTLTELMEEMQKRGQALMIIDKLPLFKEEIEELAQTKFVLRAQYHEEVKALMKRTRGCELPGTYNPLIVQDLFRMQSQPWRGILEKYSTLVLVASHRMIDAALSRVLDQTTKQGLWTLLVSDGLDGLKRSLKIKTSELLYQSEESHPITYNHYLTENVQKAQQARMKKAVQKKIQKKVSSSEDKSCLFSAQEILQMMAALTEANMENYASSSATDMMEAYYKVALKRIVDDFSCLAVEACLVSKLPDLLTPSMILKLTDAQVQQIAEESKTVTEERATLLEKAKTFEEGLAELRRISHSHQPFMLENTSDEEEEKGDEDEDEAEYADEDYDDGSSLANGVEEAV